MWSDKYRHITYTTVTSHYITNDWQLNSKVLFTSQFPTEEKKTAANIKDDIESKLALLEIYPGDLSDIDFVSDEGANIKAALSSYERLSCTAHCLNTVLKHTFDPHPERDSDDYAALKEVKNTIDACKNLVRYMKKSSLGCKLKKTLIQHVETRWNSKLLMMKSVLEQLEEIKTLLMKETSYISLKALMKKLQVS